MIQLFSMSVNCGGILILPLARECRIPNLGGPTFATFYS